MPLSLVLLVALDFVANRFARAIGGLGFPRPLSDIGP